MTKTITFKGNPVKLIPEKLVSIGETAPAFTLINKDLKEVQLKDFIGKKIVLNIFPSLDTGVCALSVKRFQTLAAEYPQLAVINISMDLPFAQKRFCSAEEINAAETLSAFRSTFGKDYGLTMADGPLKGLLARTVIVLDESGKITYIEQVPEITQEPDYQKAAQSLGLKIPAQTH